MSKLFTIARLKVAWKIIRPALGVLTIAAPGTREAKVAALVIGIVAKSGKQQDKLAVRYAQALIAKGRIDQLVKMYAKEIDSGHAAEAKLIEAVTKGGDEEPIDANGTG